MDTNDLFRRLRFALQIDDRHAKSLMQAAGYTADESDIAAWRRKGSDEGAKECPAEAIDSLMLGLIAQNRGVREGVAQPPLAKAVNNNSIAKQLRVALELRSDDLVRLVEAGGGQVSESEIGALFRKPGHRNYRLCGDQLLRQLLHGISLQQRN